MTKFLSRIALLSAVLCWVSGCAARIAERDIADAYIPLTHFGLVQNAGAAMVVATGIAATNGHNRNLVDPGAVIGEARDYDLLFFRVTKGTPPPSADPAPGMAVHAYGQDTDWGLREATGVVRQIVSCAGCTAPAYFIFAGNAGPGFSGGPVVDARGQLVGITFGYRDEGKNRLIYAYDMRRVRDELKALQTARPGR